jgi:hypothetical protein
MLGDFINVVPHQRHTEENIQGMTMQREVNDIITLTVGILLCQEESDLVNNYKKTLFKHQ